MGRCSYVKVLLVSLMMAVRTAGEWAFHAARLTRFSQLTRSGI